MVNVNWVQADTYAKSLGGRLPTEAEWEKACRGTNKVPYPWGNKLVLDATTASTLANYRGTRLAKVSPVTSFPDGASPYGTLNMMGNVWEWTGDEFKNDAGIQVRSVLGCAYDSGPTSCTCAYRDPTRRALDFVKENLGFRVVIPTDSKSNGVCRPSGS